LTAVAVDLGLDFEEGLPARVGKGAIPIPIVNSKRLPTQARAIEPENRKLGEDWDENFIKNNYSGTLGYRTLLNSIDAIKF
jgi:hypothetical protein